MIFRFIAAFILMVVSLTGFAQVVPHKVKVVAQFEADNQPVGLDSSGLVFDASNNYQTAKRQTPVSLFTIPKNGVYRMTYFFTSNGDSFVCENTNEFPARAFQVMRLQGDLMGNGAFQAKAGDVITSQLAASFYDFTSFGPSYGQSCIPPNWTYSYSVTIEKL